MHSSAPRPSPTGDAPVEGRVCETSVGNLKETFVRYDEGGKSFAYRDEGLPSVIAEGMNNWSVGPQGPDRETAE